MKIRLRKTKAKKTHKTKKSKFLFLPLIHNNEMYWLERVIIKKNFNGSNFQIVSVIRSKDLIEREIKESKPALKVIKKVV